MDDDPDDDADDDDDPEPPEDVALPLFRAPPRLNGYRVDIDGMVVVSSGYREPPPTLTDTAAPADGTDGGRAAGERANDGWTMPDTNGQNADRILSEQRLMDRREEALRSRRRMLAVLAPGDMQRNDTFRGDYYEFFIYLWRNPYDRRSAIDWMRTIHHLCLMPELLDWIARSRGVHVDMFAGPLAPSTRMRLDRAVTYCTALSNNRHDDELPRGAGDFGRTLREWEAAVVNDPSALARLAVGIARMAMVYRKAALQQHPDAVLAAEMYQAAAHARIPWPVVRGMPHGFWPIAAIIPRHPLRHTQTRRIHEDDSHDHWPWNRTFLFRNEAAILRPNQAISRDQPRSHPALSAIDVPHHARPINTHRNDLAALRIQDRRAPGGPRTTALRRTPRSSRQRVCSPRRSAP